MTRRRLWLLTTACCAALALPTVVRLVALIAPVNAWQASTLATVRRLAPQAATVLRSAAGATQASLALAGARAHTLVEQWLTPEAILHWRAGVPMAIEVAALVLAIGGLAIVFIDRRRDRRRAATPRRVRRLGRRGSPTSAIARRTGLAQDAVRQLLRPSPAPELGRFADLLAASLDPALPPPAGSRRDR